MEAGTRFLTVEELQAWKCVKLLQSCPILCDPLDYSPLDSSVHGILQRTGVCCCAVLQGIFSTQGSNLHPMFSALAGGLFTTGNNHLIFEHLFRTIPGISHVLILK